MTSLADIDAQLATAVQRRSDEQAEGHDVAVCVLTQRIQELLDRRNEISKGSACGT